MPRHCTRKEKKHDIEGLSHVGKIENLHDKISLSTVAFFSKYRYWLTITQKIQNLTFNLKISSQRQSHIAKRKNNTKHKRKINLLNSYLDDITCVPAMGEKNKAIISDRIQINLKSLLGKKTNSSLAHFFPAQDVHDEMGPQNFQTDDVILRRPW